MENIIYLCIWLMLFSGVALIAERIKKED